MMRPELYDQDGFLFRLGVGGALKIDGKTIRSKDVDVFVNDDRWNGVQYVEARADERGISEMGRDALHWDLVPDGATGSITILSNPEEDGEPIIESARRIMALDPDSVLAIVVSDPDDGHQLRRITLHGCRWDPPSAHPREKGLRLVVSAGFKAERYTDEGIHR